MTTAEAGVPRDVKEEQDFQTGTKYPRQPAIFSNEEAQRARPPGDASSDQRGILTSSYIKPHLTPQEGEVECY